MISSKAKHPNCMYMWMNHIISPKANAAVAEWFGEAPANLKACDADRGQEPLRHVPRGGRGLLLDRSPSGRRRRKDCGDDRGNVCVDYSEWVQAWTEIKG